MLFNEQNICSVTGTHQYSNLLVWWKSRPQCILSGRMPQISGNKPVKVVRTGSVWHQINTDTYKHPFLTVFYIFITFSTEHHCIIMSFITIESLWAKRKSYYSLIFGIILPCLPFLPGSQGMPEEKWEQMEKWERPPSPSLSHDPPVTPTEDKSKVFRTIPHRSTTLPLKHWKTLPTSVLSIPALCERWACPICCHSW